MYFTISRGSMKLKSILLCFIFLLTGFVSAEATQLPKEMKTKCVYRLHFNATLQPLATRIKIALSFKKAKV